jgi:Cu-Zn family superoxide dismutase
MRNVPKAAIRNVLVLATVLALSGLSMPTQAAGPEASAELRDQSGKIVGRATFTQVDGGVRVHVEVSGLTPGQHGIHIHEAGRCDPPDFTSAGGHFNPYGRRHGLKNPEGPHAGDLPNLVADAGGRAIFEATAALVTLGPGPGSLFGSAGTALVIHANPDDEMSDPAGNSGPRVACGVILRSTVAQVPGRLPRTGGAPGAVLLAAAVCGAGVATWRHVRRVRHLSSRLYRSKYDS